MPRHDVCNEEFVLAQFQEDCADAIFELLNTSKPFWDLQTEKFPAYNTVLLREPTEQERNMRISAPIVVTLKQ